MEALLSGLTWPALTQGGAVTVLIFAVVAIFRGWLVPGITVDRLTAQWEKRLTESQDRENHWRTAYLTAEAGRQVAADQVGDLMEYARTTDQFIRSLPRGGRVRP